MTTTATTTHADQLAAELRDRRNFHDGESCDPLFGMCPSCSLLTRTGQELRHIVRVPAQRKGD